MKKNIGRVFLFLACLLSVCGGARATGLLANVPEASSLTLAYQLEIPLDGNWSAFPVAYSVDNTASIAPGSFSRIAYYLELVTGTSTQWIYVAMGAFTTNATQIGVPNLASGEFFHQGLYPTAAPTNATILSNVGGIITGTGIDTVNLEFWPSNYGTGNDYGVPGADNGTYDFGDGAADGVSSGYGSMQIHNYGAQQTLFAYNSWNGGGVPCLGIGNGPVQPDWD